MNKVLTIKAPKGQTRALPLDEHLREALRKEKGSPQVTKQVGVTICPSAQNHVVVHPYIAAIARVLDINNKVGSSVLGITCDASRLGCEDTLMIAMWDPTSQSSAWLQPMVMTSDAEIGKDITARHVSCRY
jgi:hypothetical protein